MSFLFRTSHLFSLMLLPLSHNIPKPLTTRAFSICCAACHTPNFPTTRSSAYPSDVLHPVSVIFCPSYMTLYCICISVFYVLSEYSPLYRTLTSYPNDNPIFLFAALISYRISCTNKYPSYSSILCTYVCPLYAAHMSYPFYRLCSDTGCNLHTRITALMIILYNRPIYCS